MKSKTIQVVWHGKEPVYSLDFHPSGLLATAGADKEIKTWRVSTDSAGFPTVEHVDSLVGHSNTVNCVRFSPDGQTIASGADGGELMLWVATRPEDAKPQGNLVTEEEASAGYKRQAVMRGHLDDVMDLAWSQDGSAVVSGSIDNQSIVWSPETAKAQKNFDSHKHYVQGVAWDPHGQYFLTISADRMCKVHALKPKKPGKKAENVGTDAAPDEKRRKTTLERIGEFVCADSICKRVVGSSSGDSGGTKRVHLFHDETLPSFFRRLSWSPDGSFAVIPSGVYKEAVESPELHTAYLYARGKWTSPVAHVPGQTRPIVAVRFCPVIFEKVCGGDNEDIDNNAGNCESADKGENPMPALFENLPYSMVYAVATLDSVVIYDTSSSLPLAAFCQLHYDSISDLAWSKDGRFLAVSSRDGFCSIISFEDGELGKPADVESLPQVVRDVVRKMDVAPLKTVNKVAVNKSTVKISMTDENEDGNQPALSIRQEAVIKRKRIVPTPVGNADVTPTKDILESVQVAAAPAPTPLVSSGVSKEASKRKRITPQPVTDAPANIASLAAMMGQAEAEMNAH